jgi:hypothetical protein
MPRAAAHDVGMRPFASLVLFALTLGACTQTPVAEESAAPLPAAVAATGAGSGGKCDRPGQFWARRGLAGERMCVTPYPDAGKACSDRSDCTGRCIADYEAVKGQTSGSPAVGKCQADDALFGCYAEVAQGRLGPRICVD